jgi:hypothetical protein
LLPVTVDLAGGLPIYNKIVRSVQTGDPSGSDHYFSLSVDAIPSNRPLFSDPFSHDLNVNPITADVLLLCSLQMVRTILACRPDESIQLTDEFVSGAKR